jgi:type IV secretory pathway VirB2 component (pilin)
MADYSISAVLKADTRNFIQGIKKSESTLQSFGDSSEKVFGKNGFGKNIPSITKSVSSLTAVISAELVVLNKLVKSVTQYSDVYRKQLQSELQLTVAIKNNPLVNGTAADGLKEFASELQRTSNYGDEQLLPMMSQLIASGRTETEVQKIMKAAIDLSATGTMSLETAVTQLNATLSGNIGRLGMQNSELKDLTKEELENGKAIDILAKKYEGLGKAGINTSTQLKNLKGDFQEAIGRFTLPTSELWNKFWAGFYERGINVINKLNDKLETQSTGKFLTEEIYARSRELYHAGTYKGAENSREVLTNLQFLEETVKDMTEEQLLSYQKYINTLGNEAEKWQNNILLYINKEIKARQIIALDKQKDAETTQKAAEQQKTLADIIASYQNKITQQKLQWESIKQVTGDEVGLEEKLKFYQDNLVSALVESGGKIDKNNAFYQDQLKIISDIQKKITTPVDGTFAKKLIELELEGLEEYSERYHEIQLQKIEDSEKDALSTAETEEDKLSITTYYSKMREAEEKRYTKAVLDEEERLKEERKKIYRNVLEYTKSIANASIEVSKGIAKGFTTAFQQIEKVVKGLVNVFKNIFSALQKIVDFSISDSLDTILQFEDGILTFFVETLPQLPNFLSSVFNSIVVLFNSLKNTVDFKSLGNELADTFVTNAPVVINTIGDMFNDILSALPGLFGRFIDVVATYISGIGEWFANNSENLTSQLTSIINSVITSLTSFIQGGGWRNLMNGLLAIQQSIEKAVVDNIESIGEMIVSMLPDLMEMLKNSIASASRTLGKIAPTLIKVFVEVISEIIDVITSDEVIQSSLEAVEGLIAGLIPGIIKLLTKALPKIIEFLLIKLPSYTPEIISSVITGLIDAAINTNWFEVIGDIFSGFVDAFRDFFGIHSPSTLFEGFGTNIVEGLVLGLQGFANAVTTILEPVFDFVENLATGVFDALTNITQISFTGFNQSLQGVANIIDAITRSVVATTEAVTDLVEALNPLSGLTGGSSSGGGVDVGNAAVSVLTGGLVDTNASFWSNVGNVLTGGLGHLFNWFADGSNAVPRGLAVVGEAGPELVNFRGGESVLNAHNTQKALEGMSGTTINQNVVFNNLQDTTAFAMMQQLKAYNRQMAINSII